MTGAKLADLRTISRHMADLRRYLNFGEGSYAKRDKLLQLTRTRRCPNGYKREESCDPHEN